MEYSQRAGDALAFTFDLHATQTRKGAGAPYITHLIAVAALVGEYGGNEDQFIAALLHDAVEDQGGRKTLALIRERYGARVAELVLGASETDDTPKPPWRSRKEQHIAKMAAAGAELKLIVAADKLHNMRSVLRDLRIEGPRVWENFTGRCDGTLWYYREMRAALAEGWEHPILEELDEVIRKLHADAGVEQA